MKSPLTKYLTLFAFAATGIGSAQQYVFVDLTASQYASESANAQTGGIQGGYGQVPNTTSALAPHALMWTGTSASAVDINPSGWNSSEVWGAAAGQLVGFGVPVPVADISGGRRALLWLAPGNYIDLTPSSFGNASAFCTTGVIQGGWGYAPKSGKNGGKTLPMQHALIWRGAASTFVDMQPAGMSDSRIWACADSRQVGDATPAVSPIIGATHAMMWFGTPAGAIDLHPVSGFLDSKAFGIAGNEQVGSGQTSTTTTRHALLWRGTPDSAVDLHPAGFQISVAWGTNGVQEVGYALDAQQLKHAMVWSGTAASAFDLNQFLPAGYMAAEARTIDVNGNVIGSATISVPGSTVGVSHAAMWIKVQ